MTRSTFKRTYSNDTALSWSNAELAFLCVKSDEDKEKIQTALCRDDLFTRASFRLR